MPGELGYDTGPFVTLAVFCDQAIEAKDGVLTLIRIIDQVTLQAIGEGAPADLPRGSGLNTTLVVGLKAGQARGRQNLKVDLIHPDGTRHPGQKTFPVHFSMAEHQGANAVLTMGLALSDAGVYWAEVLVNDRLMTRTPLEVRYEVNPPGTQAP